jgi:hypothetical protein
MAIDNVRRKAGDTREQIEQLELNTLVDLVLQLRPTEAGVEQDLRDAEDLKKRVEDLKLTMRDVVKTMVKEMHQELIAKTNERQA